MLLLAVIAACPITMRLHVNIFPHANWRWLIITAIAAAIQQMYLNLYVNAYAPLLPLCAYVFIEYHTEIMASGWDSKILPNARIPKLYGEKKRWSPQYHRNHHSMDTCVTNRAPLNHAENKPNYSVNIGYDLPISRNPHGQQYVHTTSYMVKLLWYCLPMWVQSNLLSLLTVIAICLVLIAICRVHINDFLFYSRSCFKTVVLSHTN